MPGTIFDGVSSGTLVVAFLNWPVRPHSAEPEPIGKKKNCQTGCFIAGSGNVHVTITRQTLVTWVALEEKTFWQRG